MFGTYSLFEAAQICNTRIALEKKYKLMFTKRENYRYHIGAAEARGTIFELVMLILLQLVTFPVTTGIETSNQ